MRVQKAKLLLPAVLTIVFASFAFVPGFARAETAPSVTAVQLLQNAPSCSAPQVLSVTPYVYNGTLQGFDAVVADGSYVAIGGNAGSEAIPLQFISRWGQQNGAVRIHVDVPDVPVVGTMPVSLTMLAAKAGQGICAATATFTIKGPAVPRSVPSPISLTKPASSSSQAAARATTSQSSTTPVVAVTVTSNSLSNLASIARVCSTNQGAYELWLSLLALYFIFVTIVVFADVPNVRDSALASTAVILVPLLALFALWYIVPECRVSVWVGLAASLIALGGLAGLLQDRSKLPLLPPAKTT